MRIQQHELDKAGYQLDRVLVHDDSVIDFVLDYFKRRYLFTRIYITISFLLLLLSIWLSVVGFASNLLSWGDIGVAMLWTLSLSVLSIPVHELLHALAYKILGAKDIHFGHKLEVLMFYTIAHKFVINARELYFVAFVPFLVLSVLILAVIPFVNTQTGLLISYFATMHSTFCGGDVAISNYFYLNRAQQPLGFDNAGEKASYFLLKKG